MSHHILIAVQYGPLRDTFSRRVVGVLSATAIVASCMRPVSAEPIFGLAAQGAKSVIVEFDSATPGALNTVAPANYYDGIDYRPADGRVYVLDAQGARIRRLNAGNLQPDNAYLVFPGVISGFNWGFDFDPVANQARLISETGQNIGAVPVLGTPGESGTAFPNVAYAAGDPNFGIHPNIVDLAYSNNVPNASNTTLYGIDTGLDVLVTVNQVTGVLTTVGPLGVNVNAAGGFDISRFSGTAYAALLPSSSSNSSLYTINLATGAATAIGSIDGGILITGLTVVPEPASAMLIVSGLVWTFSLRRRVS